MNAGERYIDCARCTQSYHGLCANISDKELQKMTIRMKKDWLCPDCVCKIPKGDNSNTPIRASPATTSTSSNVTLRRNFTGSQPPEDDNEYTDEADTIPCSELRMITNEIIKE
jgi:hypothetical protein